MQTVNPSVQNSGCKPWFYSLPGPHRVNEQETPEVQARRGPGMMGSDRGTGSTGVAWENHENSDSFLTKEPPVLQIAGIVLKKSIGQGSQISNVWLSNWF